MFCRHSGARPEGREPGNWCRACIWIPGPALTRRPGMTGVDSLLGHARPCAGHPA